MSSLNSRIDSSRYLKNLEKKIVNLDLSFKGQLPLKDQLPILINNIFTSLNDKKFDQTGFDQNKLDQAEQVLIDAKTEFTYLWSLAELQKVGSQEERGRWQTTFAEVTIEYALRMAWLSVALKNKALLNIFEKHDGIIPGLFIFGMGKLGGFDLNFSSDVDLVAYFDPEILPVAEMLGKSYICHQVLQKLTQLLNQKGNSNFIWRVDWRLRPNASATTLAMSTIAAEDYYFYRASPWHRLALMKARVVAGDKSLGNQFLEDLTPFIWRQNLDYRALDELAEIKQRINLEHPSLRTQRQWREPIVDQIEGFNVKLGSGGIREIEFIANALQLVWGGRQFVLRTPHTVTALKELANNQHLELEDASQLIGHYQFLRRIENSIQMLENQQTHLIPSSETNKQSLLKLLDINSWSELVNEINQARRFVNARFEILFAEQESAQQSAPIWPEKLSVQAEGIIDLWEEGYQAYGVSNEVRHRLLPLTSALASYLVNDKGDSSNAIVRLHDFFRALPQGEQYFRLLAKSPSLLNKFVLPLIYSPPMTTLLKQSPHIIDCYVHQEWQYPQAFDSSDVFHAQSYETQLERMRRFVNEYLYQLYLSFFEGEIDVDTFQAALTDLAEQTLEVALKVVANEQGFEKSPITVIGMGKVALKRMSPLSDLDLIFVFDPATISLESASRFVSRLQTAISTPMREGIVYELDTRLRPSGRSGAPVVSIESLENHHLQRAHTWEHIALMPSRVVAGEKTLVDQIDDIKRKVLLKERDSPQLMRDALKMWDRISEHRITDSTNELMSSKLSIGGLMQAEYLASCLVLKNSQNVDCKNVCFDALLKQSVENELRSELGINQDVTQLPEVIQFWRIQQLWERLLGKTDQAIDSIASSYLERLLMQSGVESVEQLIEKKKQYALIVTNATQQLFEPLDMNAKAIDEWHETAVKWLE